MEEIVKIKNEWKNRKNIEKFVENAPEFGFKTADDLINKAIEFYLDTHRQKINEYNEIELPYDVLTKLGRGTGDYVVFRINNDGQIILE